MVHVRGARAGASGIIPPSRAGMWCVRGSWVGCPFFSSTDSASFTLFFFLLSFLSYQPSTFTILSFVVSRSMKKQPSAHGRMHRWKACRLGILSWLPSRRISTLCSAACVYLCIVVVVNIFLLLIMAIVMVKSGDAVAFFKSLRIISSAPTFVHHYFFWWFFFCFFFLFAVCLFRRGTVESSFYLYFISLRLFCKDDPLHKFFHQSPLLLPVCLFVLTAFLNRVLVFLAVRFASLDDYQTCLIFA